MTNEFQACDLANSQILTILSICSKSNLFLAAWSSGQLNISHYLSSSACIFAWWGTLNFKL